MKTQIVATLFVLTLLSACGSSLEPISAQTAVANTAIASALTVTPYHSATLTPSRTPTATEEPTKKPTNTPTFTITPSETPTQEIEPTPQPFTLYHKNNIAAFPSQVFGTKSVYFPVGDYYIEGPSDAADTTIIERLSSYPEFEGDVVHVVINGSTPATSMQHAFVEVNRMVDKQFAGPWAYEVSLNILKAPRILVDSGWMGDPIASLSSLLMHLNNDSSNFSAAGGVTLIGSGNGQYYVQQYRVNNGMDPGVTPNREKKVPFKLGVKQGIRNELFYDPDNNNAASLRSFLITFTDQGPVYTYIGTIPLEHKLNKILGDITWVGAYVSNQVLDYEVIAGEGKVFR